MRIPTTLKKIAKALFLYYLFTELVAAVRLARFKIKCGAPTVFFSLKDPRSSLPIDLVIPVVDKDAETLPFVIDSAREFIRHPIADVYLVCPGNSVLVKKIALAKGCKVVDEKDLVPVTPKDIRYDYKGCNRGSWVYQQFLKWSGGKFCTQRHYLVMDSDTVFVRPQVFEIDGKIVFDFCDWVHQPYFSAFEKIFGIAPRSTLSFTSHHALIDIEVMDRLMRDIEAANGMPWYSAIIAAIDEGQQSCVSDYDNYGLYFYEKTPMDMIVRYWHNKSLPRAALGDIHSLVPKYGRLYNTLSFHSYNT